MIHQISKSFFLLSALFFEVSVSQVTCSAGAHIIVARASTEPPGTGIIGAIANRVAERIPGSDIVAVNYPATLREYVESESAGVVEMRKLVVEYATACPKSSIVLMGYSQVFLLFYSCIIIGLKIDTVQFCNRVPMSRPMWSVAAVKPGSHRQIRCQRISQGRVSHPSWS